MSEENVSFSDRKVKKSDFCKNKKVIKIDDIDVIKILVSNKEPYGANKSIKYFIGYNDDDDIIRPLYIKVPQMIGYVKCFDSNKTMSFKAIYNKYTQIWKKVKNLLNIKFDEEPVYGDNDKYTKTKIKKLYGVKINTNFWGTKVPKQDAVYKGLSLIILDSVVRVNKKHFPQTLLEECKYEMKKIKMENLINDDLEPTSSDDDNGTDIYDI